MLMPGGIVGKICWAVSLLMFGACGAAFAAGYDDLANGIAANLREDSPAAIASFSAAIAAGDLSPAMLTSAYGGRALAHLHSRECQASRADAEAALALTPGDETAALLRAGSQVCLGDLPGAETDYTAILNDGSVAAAFTGRGWTRFDRGDFAGAAQDFSSASDLVPKFYCGILWLEMARRRAGTFDAAAADAEMDPLRLKYWPGPLIELFAGRKTPQDIAAPAADGEGKRLARQLCEADFYIAEWHLAGGDAAAARPLLQRVMDRCTDQFDEYFAARQELERLK